MENKTNNNLEKQNKNRKFLTIFLTFIFLFITNVLVLKLISMLGFNVVVNETSYLLPPLISTAVLVIIENRRKKRKK